MNVTEAIGTVTCFVLGWLFSDYVLKSLIFGKKKKKEDD